MIRLSGRVRSSLIIGFQGIRARKLRTLLSMVSLFLGVLAVVVVQAGAETAERALMANLELVEGKDGTVRMYLPGEPEVVPVALEAVRGRTDVVATITTTAIIGEPGVSPVNPGPMSFDRPEELAFGPEGPRFGSDGPGGPGGPIGPDMGDVPDMRNVPRMICDARGCIQIDSPDAGPAPPGRAIEVNLTAVTGDIRQFRPFRPQSGQWLDFDSPPSMAPRIVLNKAAAKGFGLYRVPAEMRVNGATANTTPRIIGVIDDGNEQPAAYVRADELLNWVPRSDGANPVYGGGINLMFTSTNTDTERLLRARLAAVGLHEASFPAETINSKKRITEELALMRWVFLGMAGIVLLIGVAGILNVGLATVGERIEEFALRRAVGTPRSLLAGIVLAETLLTGLFTAGAAIGVMVAVLELGLNRFGPSSTLQNLAFPWQAAVAGVIAGLVAGLLGGFIPALRAARIPIATVMRA